LTTTQKALASVRVAAVACIWLACILIAYQVIHTWHLWTSAAPDSSEHPHYFALTSPWTFFLPSLLFAALAALCALPFLRDPTSRSWLRLAVELITTAVVLVGAWVLWHTLYLAYNPNHSGPFL
jgi:hypothetical protein